jgi:hypothetical protein
VPVAHIQDQNYPLRHKNPGVNLSEIRESGEENSDNESEGEDAAPLLSYSAYGFDQSHEAKPLTCKQKTAKYIIRFLCLTAGQTFYFSIRGAGDLARLAVTWGEGLAGDDVNPIDSGTVALTSIPWIAYIATTMILNSFLARSKTAEDIATGGLALPKHPLGKAVMIASFILCVLPAAAVFLILSQSAITGPASCLPPLTNRTAGYTFLYDATSTINRIFLTPGLTHTILSAYTAIGCSLMMTTNYYQVPYAQVMALISWAMGSKLTLDSGDLRQIRRLLEGGRIHAIPFMTRLDKTIAVYKENSLEIREMTAPQILAKIHKKIQGHGAETNSATTDLFAQLIAILLYTILLAGFLSACNYIEIVLNPTLGDASIPTSLLLNIVSLITIAVFTTGASNVYQTLAYTAAYKCRNRCKKGNTLVDKQINRMFWAEFIKLCLLPLAILPAVPAMSNTNSVAVATHAGALITLGMILAAAANASFFTALGLPKSLDDFIRFCKEYCGKKKNGVKPQPLEAPSYYAGYTDGIGAIVKKGSVHKERIALFAKHNLAFLIGPLALAVCTAAGWTRTGNTPLENATARSTEMNCHSGLRNITVENVTFSCPWQQQPNDQCLDLNLKDSIYYPFLSSYVLAATFAYILVGNQLFNEGTSFGRNVIRSLASMALPFLGMVAFQLMADLSSNGGFGSRPAAGLAGDANTYLLGFLLLYAIPGFATANAPFCCQKKQCEKASPLSMGLLGKKDKPSSREIAMSALPAGTVTTYGSTMEI